MIILLIVYVFYLCCVLVQTDLEAFGGPSKVLEHIKLYDFQISFRACFILLWLFNEFNVLELS